MLNVQFVKGYLHMEFITPCVYPLLLLFNQVLIVRLQAMEVEDAIKACVDSDQ